MGVVKTIEIKANLKDAEKNFQELNEQLKIQRDVLLDLEKQIYDVEKAQKSTSKSNLSVQKKLSDQAKELKNELKGEKLGLKELNNERSASISQITNLSKAQASSSKIVKGLDKFTGGYATKLKKVFLGTKEAAKGIKLFVSGLSGLKKALIATGVGALVVALGVVVAYWDDIKALIGGVSVELQKQENKIRKQILEQETQIDLLKQQVKLEELKTGESELLTKEYKKHLLLQNEQNIALLENLQTQLQLEKSKKKEVGFFTKIGQSLGGVLGANINILATQSHLEKNYGKQSELIEKINEAKKKGLSIEIAIAGIDAEARKKKNKADEETIKTNKKKADEELKAEKDKADAIERIRKGLIDTEDERRAEALRKIEDDYKEQIKLAEKYYGEESQKVKDLKEAQKNALDEQQAKFNEQDKKKKEEESKIAAEKLVLDKEQGLLSFDEQRALISEREGLLKEDTIINDKDKLKLTKQFSDAKIKIDELEAKAQKKRVADTSKALDTLSDVVGKNTVAGKGMSIAAATINTYQGVTDALAAKTITPFETALKFVNAAGILSNGLKTVKQITAVKIPNTSGGSGTGGASAPSGGGLSTPSLPPAFNVVGASETSQLADSIGSQSQEPTRAYVVSADVTTSQEMDRNTIEGASI
tara:strand:- start:6094 stop:8043 length:1950 start_codon:yes stop_codon:yes gene_type:complete